MSKPNEPGNSWLGKPFVLSPEVTLGALLRVEEHDGQLFARRLEKWESPGAIELIFRVEEGLAHGQLRIRRVRPPERENP